ARRGSPCSRRPSSVGLLGLDVLDSRQAPLTLDDAERAVAVLRLDEVVERACLVDFGRNVDRPGRRHLAAPGEGDRELRLLERADDALRLRDELGLAKPARRLRRDDEPLRVLRAEIVVDAVLDRLGAELRDRVARVDALGAALIAEVAAGAVPDPVLFVERVQARDVVLVARVA